MSLFPASLTVLVSCLAVLTSLGMNISTPAALYLARARLGGRLGGIDASAAGHQALACQGRLLALDEPDQGLEVHVVPISVREDVPLDLGICQSNDHLVLDHLLCVADVSVAASFRTLDSITTDGCQAPHPSGELPDGLAPVLLHLAELDPVDSFVPLGDGNLLQLG